MILEYETLLSSEPIALTIGTIRQPTLRDIRKLGFYRYNLYKLFMKMTPELYYTHIEKNKLSVWEALSEQERENLHIFDIINSDNVLSNTYLEIFNYFFVENIIYNSNLFIILNKQIEDEESVELSDVKGVIYKENFTQVLEILQQICGIYEKEGHEENLVFKNEKARAIYEKIKKAEKENKKAESEATRSNPDYSIPNIISVVSNVHPCLTPITVWDLTVFQLLDSFNRQRMFMSYRINATSVSVWGDEKGYFKPDSWFRNEYERQ